MIIDTKLHLLFVKIKFLFQDFPDFNLPVPTSSLQDIGLNEPQLSWINPEREARNAGRWRFVNTIFM